MPQTNLPSTTLRFDISKRFTRYEGPPPPRFSSNSFSGVGSREFQRLVFKILENIEYDIPADSVVDLLRCCHHEIRTRNEDRNSFFPVV